VPNVSEGTDRALIDRLAAAFSAEAALLDAHSDRVHNRSVFTLAAAPDALAASLLTGARAAIEAIDMTLHSGAHPCVGALDVCPIVHPDPADAEPAAALAREVAERLAELGLPVFFYGALAREGDGEEERHERAFFRGGGLEALAARLAAGELEPDLGPSVPHPRGGAVLVTARGPLAAFNVELVGVGLAAAREIAAGVREAGGGPAGVRAIGIELGAGRVQVSTNIHDPVAVPLGAVVELVRRRAVALGGRPAAAELVGLVPAAALEGYPADVPIRGFDPAERTIEARLARIDGGAESGGAAGH
jgi:glutamate formiminotransferase / 5-formyltetrahydrofolate cyclo-ligase